MMKTGDIEILVFISAGILITYFSRKSLRNPKSHGFYRYFAWMGLVGLGLLVYPEWFQDPFSLRQILSWGLLVAAGILPVWAAISLQSRGKPGQARSEDGLIGFEKTTVLVDDGIYRFIRHPMYSSLIFLDAGMLLKAPSVETVLLAVAIFCFLLATAWIEEEEDLRFFGEIYRDYSKKTKRFLPLIF